MERKYLPFVVVGGLIGIVTLTVCAAPPPRISITTQAQPTITSVVGSGPTATPVPPIPFNDTPVKHVRTLRTVAVYGGPSTQYVTVGAAAEGAILRVTGVSTDGLWWRIPCDTRSQIRNQVDCWVNADPTVTTPANDAEAAPAAPAATDTAVPPPPAPTDTPAPAPAATDTAVPPPPAPTDTPPPPPPTAVPTEPPAPTATAVPPTPIPSPTAAPPTPTTAAGTGGAIDLKETSVTHIITSQDVPVLDVPQTGAVIGTYPAGQKIEVTGYTSADGMWWRVVCPDGTAGNCFVTADPAYTAPAVAPK